MSVLVIAEHDNATLKAGTLSAVTAAQAIAQDITVLVAGSGCGAVAEAAAKVNGVSKVLVADNAAYEHQLPESVAPLIAELGSQYSHILAPATTSGKNLLPRVAALLDVAQITDMVQVKSEDTFVRPVYAGNALATVQSSDPIKVITVRTTAFGEAASGDAAAPIENTDIVKTQELSSFVGEELSVSERPELTAASVVISGGRGMQSGENFALLEKVADKLGAAIGASRAAVDAGSSGGTPAVDCSPGPSVARTMRLSVSSSWRLSRSTGVYHPESFNALMSMEAAPCVTDVEKELSGEGLYWPVWSRKP